MEFAVLAARIGAGRQRGEQTGIEAAAGKRGRQFLQVDHGEMRLDAGIDHRPRQLMPSAAARAETPA